MCIRDRPWELQEAIIEHNEPLTYLELHIRAIKAIGGAYVTYGAMSTLEEKLD